MIKKKNMKSKTPLTFVHDWPFSVASMYPITIIIIITTTNTKVLI